MRDGGFVLESVEAVQRRWSVEGWTVRGQWWGMIVSSENTRQRVQLSLRGISAAGVGDRRPPAAPCGPPAAVILHRLHTYSIRSTSYSPGYTNPRSPGCGGQGTPSTATHDASYRTAGLLNQRRLQQATACRTYIPQ